jgi:hypothetical protein
MAEFTLTRKGTNRRGTHSIYNGLPAGPVRFSNKKFAGAAPESFLVQVEDGVFAEAPRKLTKEERKAQRANAPKPTLADKIAKREAALEKLRQKAAAEAAAQQTEAAM